MKEVTCKLTGLEKSFGRNHVLRGIDLELRAGEVTALMGANGAGKSTMVKVLCGYHAADAGTMELGGAPYDPSDAADAISKGVVTVHQSIDDGVIPDLDVATNLTLDRLTEPGAGSDATAMKTRFVPAGDNVRIDGAKVFITNGGVADYYIVFGKWAPLGDGRDAISLVYVPGDTPGLTVDRLEDKMGHRGSATAALIFDNCIVPQSHMIGDPGAGLTMLHGFLDRSRPSVSAHALGIARAAFEDAISYVNERVQSGKRIVEFQGIQFLLADLAAELVMCENLLWSLAERVDRGKSISAVEASILKMRCSDLAMRATTEAVQLHGGYGYCRDFRVERLMRDAKVTQIWEGTNQIHRRIIGRSFVER